MIRATGYEMTELGRAICLYIENNDGAYPISLELLASSGYVTQVEGENGDYYFVTSDEESKTFPYAGFHGVGYLLSNYKLRVDCGKLLLESKRYCSACERTTNGYAAIFSKSSAASTHVDTKGPDQPLD